MASVLSKSSEQTTSEPLPFQTQGDRCAADFEKPDTILPAPTPSVPEFDVSENGIQPSTEQPQEMRHEITPLIRLSMPRPPQRRFEIVQQWEGVVTDIEADAVFAELLDLTNPSHSREVVELPLIEISEADQRILRPGSVFYWAIGYERSVGGQIRRVSEIRLRRTPIWSQHQIDSVKARAKKLYERYSGNDQRDSSSS